MRGAVPLFIDVGVTAFAGLRLHEIFCGNVLAVSGLHRTGKKLAAGAVAFAVHSFRRHGRIHHAVAVAPGDVAHPPETSGDASRQQSQHREAGYRAGKSLAKISAALKPRSS